MQIISLAPANPLTLRRALEQVSIAEQASILGGQSTVTERDLSAGVTAARSAAALLRAARPVNEFHHLDWAAKSMIEVADALTSATIVRHAAGSGFATNVQALADVRRLAHLAYGAVDNAFEAIDNN